MLKRIALLATAFILLGCASANADTKNSAGTQTAYTTQNSQKTSAKELSRFKTIGEVAAYLSSAMLAGFESE